MSPTIYVDTLSWPGLNYQTIENEAFVQQTRQPRTLSVLEPILFLAPNRKSALTPRIIQTPPERPSFPFALHHLDSAGCTGRRLVVPLKGKFQEGFLSIFRSLLDMPPSVTKLHPDDTKGLRCVI